MHVGLFGSIKNLLRMLVALFLLVVVALTGFAMYGLKYEAFQFDDNYERRMVPLYQVERIGGMLEEIRSQLLLSIQHQPGTEFVSAHNHPTSLHTDLIRKREQEVNRMWQEFQSVWHGEEANQLAAVFERDLARFLQDGVNPAVRLIDEGAYVRANWHILQQVNPLFAAVDKARADLSDRKLRGAQEARSNMAATAQLLNIQLLAVGIIGLLLAFGFAFFVIRRINRGMDNLGALADGMAAGDFRDQPLPFTPNEDEVGRITQRFIHTRSSLAQLAREIGQVGESLSEQAERGAAMAEQSRGGIQAQKAETDLVATAMYEMNATVHDVAKSAATAAESATAADESAHHGQSVVTESVDGMNHLASEVESAAQVIAELAEDAQAIGKVVDVIREIAEQTNLLALNAAIEAARAGEQGRGFAVVADEVRSLAGRTQSSTTEIHDMISHLQGAAAKAAKVMQQGQQQATEGVEKAARANEALEEIIQQIMRMNDMNTQIASAAEEQSSVADEMNQNLNRINMAADETSLAADSVAATSQEIAALALQLKKAVSKFRH
jgi:methyl-accepting chemotaxis protein